MSTRDDLIAAKALIDTPEKWGKGMGRAPANLCALDTCERVCKQERGYAWARLESMVRALRGALPPGREAAVYQFNDDPSTTHADIMALFDRAIAAS